MWRSWFRPLPSSQKTVPVRLLSEGGLLCGVFLSDTRRRWLVRFNSSIDRQRLDRATLPLARRRPWRPRAGGHRPRAPAAHGGHRLLLRQFAIDTPPDGRTAILWHRGWHYVTLCRDTLAGSWVFHVSKGRHWSKPNISRGQYWKFKARTVQIATAKTVFTASNFTRILRELFGWFLSFLRSYGTVVEGGVRT